jgi:RNA polymerase sigma-70 factor, ECF subfamily
VPVTRDSLLRALRARDTLSCAEPAGGFHIPGRAVSSLVMGAQPFETIVGAHHAEIYRYLRRVTSRTTEAEDLSQETFLRAYRAYRSLGPDANVRAWLFAIATNLSRNHFRSEKRRRVAHQAMSVENREADPEGPEHEARLGEARTLLEGTVQGLPLKQRLAFIMRKIHDLDYEAIGRSLDCSAESARAHVFQALRKIRRALGELAIAPTGTGEPRA